jgi:phosphatidylserine/phosphatidylglycerophosphate/cardiolipin synthase-like enzyme
MIRGAKQRLDLEHFYLSRKPGEALDPVLDELGRASARGVKVRLILDAGMHRTYPQPADSLGKLANVSVRTIDYHRIAGGVQHAKFMVVDDREAWLGSQNLDWRALSHIHELGARVRPRAGGEDVRRRVRDRLGGLRHHPPCGCERPQAREVADRVHAGWREGRAVAEREPEAAVAAVAALGPRRARGPAERGAARDRGAVPELRHGRAPDADSTLHKALLAAAARGVKVKLIVSDWVIGGRGEADLRALAATPGIEVRISQVPEWSGGYIPFARVEHCKFMVADSSWLWLGTSNWEPSYFLATRNIAITVHHGPLARRARGIFETSWNAPSAAALSAGVTLAKRVHGETPPPGATNYGE